MKIIVRSLAALGAVLVVAALAVGGDIVFDHGRLISAAVGRDAVAGACTPALVVKLKAAGFEPTEVELGDSPDVAISIASGRSLKDSFTFMDGAASARVDGIVACVVRHGVATVDFRTQSTPMRAG